MLNITVDPGNRLTKFIGGAVDIPKEFPTVLCSAEGEAMPGISLALTKPYELSLENLLAEVIKDGVSLGKNYIGKSSEKKSPLKRNHEADKAGDMLIQFSVLTAAAFALLGQKGAHREVVLTIIQPLREYLNNPEQSRQGFIRSLKGDIEVVFYNPQNPEEAVKSVKYSVKDITFKVETLAAWEYHASGGMRTLLCDIGSGQTNIAVFEGSEVIVVDTIENGIISLYKQAANMIYSRNKDRLDKRPDYTDVDDAVRYEGCLMKSKKGEQIDISDVIKTVFGHYTYEFLGRINEFIRYFDIARVVLAGGGSIPLADSLSKALEAHYKVVRGGPYDNILGALPKKQESKALMTEEKKVPTAVEQGLNILIGGGKVKEEQTALDTKKNTGDESKREVLKKYGDLEVPEKYKYFIGSKLNEDIEIGAFTFKQTEICTKEIINYAIGNKGIARLLAAIADSEG